MTVKGEFQIDKANYNFRCDCKYLIDFKSILSKIIVRFFFNRVHKTSQGYIDKEMSFLLILNISNIWNRIDDNDPDWV